MNREREDLDADTLLVGVSNPATVPRLVEICSVLERTGDWNILFTHVVRVANQISLTTGGSSPDVIKARDFVRQAQTTADAASVPAKGLVEVARSVDEGLLAAAESHRARMILVGYSEWKEEQDPKEGEEEGEFDRTMHRVARKASMDVVVAKFRRETPERILVPVGDGSHGRLVPLLARAFSLSPSTSVTFLHVTDAEGSVEEGRRRMEGWMADRGLGERAELKVERGEDPAEAVLRESRNHDLIIVGPSRRPGIMGGIFTGKARAIAEGTTASVLVTWDRVSG